jgi:hypothetical protein
VWGDTELIGIDQKTHKLLGAKTITITMAKRPDIRYCQTLLTSSTRMFDGAVCHGCDRG